jgi:hypothetical protein
MAHEAMLQITLSGSEEKAPDHGGGVEGSVVTVGNVLIGCNDGGGRQSVVEDAVNRASGSSGTRGGDSSAVQCCGGLLERGEAWSFSRAKYMMAGRVNVVVAAVKVMLEGALAKSVVADFCSRRDGEGRAPSAVAPEHRVV